MASNYIGIIDMAQAQDPHGYYTRLVNTLARVNEIFYDFPVEQGNFNAGDAYRYQAVAQLPGSTMRKYNEGIEATAAHFRQSVVDSQEFSAMSSIDYSLPNASSFLSDIAHAQEVNSWAVQRLDRGLLHVESLSQAIAKRLFAPRNDFDTFSGFADYYPNAESGGEYYVDTGLRSPNQANTDYWMVNWGSKVFTFVPKGSIAGFRHIDMGLSAKNDDTDFRRLYPAMQDFYAFKFGLVIKDMRCVARLTGIGTDQDGDSVGGPADISEAGFPQSRKLLETLEKMMVQIEGGTDGRRCLYMTKRGYHVLRIALNRAGKYFPGGWVDSMNQNGSPNAWGSYQGFCIRRCDGILNNY